MNEKQLTVRQLEHIMNWSYPTALSFAKRHGELMETPGQEKFYIPVSAVNDKIYEQVLQAQVMQERLDDILPSAPYPYEIMPENGTNS